MTIKEFFRAISRARFPYRPLITIEISRDRLWHNIAEFQKLNPRVPLVPVLKSNAYGHGLVQVSKILSACGDRIPFLVVDSYFEALALRNAGVRRPLLIIGYTPPHTAANNKLSDVAFTVTSVETLNDLAKHASKKTRIHLKINTGMNRQGIEPSELEKAFALFASNRKLSLDGILSHFADADNINSTFTRRQITVWNECVDKTLVQFPKITYYHLSNTPGQMYGNSIKANVSRLGLGLYGFNDGGPLGDTVNLLPILKFKTIVSSIRTVEAGEKIGYGLTFTASRRMQIATIPVGYYEGIDRRLSNKGFVKIKNNFAPIVGRVSMNITVIDITDIPDVKIDDEVVVISDNPEDKNSVQEIAKLCETSPYDVTVHIPGQLLRVVV